MKLSRLMLAAAIACGVHAGRAAANENHGNEYDVSVSGVSSYSGGDCDLMGCDCDGAGACDGACGGCSDSGCELGDPFQLFGEHCGWSAGGWVQLGYHSQAGGMRFNNHPDRFNLHQAWLYAEKAIDAENGFDLGGRVDYVYGVDAQDTQAFGTDPRGWDNDWDNGIYGHALPQAYLEAGYGKLSVKAGHFFTPIGYEVVAAPDNFFYSHKYTHYNSEPFTHTGALATYAASEHLSLFGGYTLGWDSGFDDNGDNFLGGFTAGLTDDLSLTYATAIGRFGEARFNGVEKGYMHSLILTAALADDLKYIIQNDYLDTEDDAGERVRNTFAIAQYLLYTINDCWSAGARLEWWNVSEGSTGFHGENANLPLLATLAGGDGSIDVYDLTFGLNYRPHANVLIRPEVRWDWVKEDAAVLNAADITINEQNDASQTTFGVDTIFTF